MDEVVARPNHDPHYISHVRPIAQRTFHSAHRSRNGVRARCRIPVRLLDKPTFAQDNMEWLSLSDMAHGTGAVLSHPEQLFLTGPGLSSSGQRTICPKPSVRGQAQRRNATTAACI